MRFKSLCSLGLMTAIGGPLCAGWKITTLTTTAEGRRTTGTEYFQGDLRRTESQPGKDGASELRIDGWYVDADSLPRYKRSGGISFFQPRGVPVPVIKVNFRKHGADR
jgi:hypothetical protein